MIRPYSVSSSTVLPLQVFDPVGVQIITSAGDVGCKAYSAPPHGVCNPSKVRIPVLVNATDESVNVTHGVRAVAVVEYVDVPLSTGSPVLLDEGVGRLDTSDGSSHDPGNMIVRVRYPVEFEYSRS